MASMFDYFIVIPPHLAFQSIKELEPLGALDAKESPTGIYCHGDLAFGYKACLHSRLANRVLLKIAQFDIANTDELYEGVTKINWSEHLGPDNTLAVSATTRHSEINHSHFVMLRVKDAIVDDLRRRFQDRPQINKNEPDVRVHAHLDKDSATIYVDLSGASLHQRGYRQESGLAPIKENIAAAMLRISGWSEAAEQGEDLVDPMCGTGTIPIEAALIATHTAPGIFRKYFGFLKWRGHNSALWSKIRAEAQERMRGRAKSGSQIIGFDQNARVIEIARQTARNAGMDQVIRFEVRGIQDARPAPRSKGIVISNPPYGKRLGQVDALRPVYADLGRVLREHFGGYQAFILTSAEELAYSLGLRASRKRKINNGGIECDLLEFALEKSSENRENEKNSLDNALVNRLKKNFDRVRTWAESVPTDAYRVYDADLPEYNFALDVYGKFAHLQEYAAPKDIPISTCAARASIMISVVEKVLGIPRTRISYKIRKRQKGRAQYSRLNEREKLIEINEKGNIFLVNLWDYLDTGLFLDHRPVRAKIHDMALEKRFLNLFCYTGSATVYAAAGGALETTSVDLSDRYLEWAKRNMQCNGFRGRQHRYVCADVINWLEADKQKYDLIFIDPPTFSNSKRSKRIFDVQRDHAGLVHLAAQRLDTGGLIYFSTNRRKFRLDLSALPEVMVKDITRSTLPKDFQRRGNMHSCFEIRLKPGATLGKLKRVPGYDAKGGDRKRTERKIVYKDKRKPRPGGGARLRKDHS